MDFKSKFDISDEVYVIEKKKLNWNVKRGMETNNGNTIFYL